jgi:histidine ammonia-lyase
MTDFPVTLDGESLALEEFIRISEGMAPVVLSAQSLTRVERARSVVEARLKAGGTFYGINTGFGALAKVRIGPDKLEQLQLNLIRSHACGVGDLLPETIVRGILALRIQTMLRGHSGVRPETVQLMVSFLNHRIHPCVPAQGSVGACGDLAPLAHLAQALIGEGDVFFRGERMEAGRALELCQLAPLSPGAKEGLSLINGTQVMTAIGLDACNRARYLLQAADASAATTLDAIKGTPVAFADVIQSVRNQPYQADVARNVRVLLQDDPIVASHFDCDKVQDPYSIRCVPQVHGAVRHAHAHALDVLLGEANSSTDNPLVFVDEDAILSGGNFHGAPVSYVLDYLAIVLTDLGSIAERRIEKLVNPHMSGLPAFLTRDSGLNSGHMITHVVAAALTNENKVYASPASCDSIPTSAEQEDHVSMGMTSALKLRRIIENVANILAIELIAAAQGLEFHKPLSPSKGIGAIYDFVRQRSPAMDVDRSLSADIRLMKQSILSGELQQALQEAGFGMI